MLYQQIKQYLGYGLMVDVIDKCGKSRMFYHAHESGTLTSETGLSWDEQEINSREKNNGWRIHSLLPRPITPYPVGMKVRVDEGYREMKINLPYDTDNIVEKIERVRVTDNGSYVYELSDNSEIDHRFLIPVLEEEKTCVCEPGSLCKAHGENTTKDSWLQAGRKNGWIKGGEVIE